MERKTWFVIATFAVSLGLASTASAQPAAAAQHEEDVAEAPAEPPPDPVLWDLAAGGVLTTGNTENLTATLGSHFLWAELPHSVEAELAYILGMSGDGYDTKNAESLNLRARYDYFFDEMNALFAAARFRYDEFAGLAPRLQGQLGYLRNFFRENEGKHRFWGEIGYDITADTFKYDRLNIDPMVLPTLPSDQVTHSARLFVGYDNHVTETLTFRTGLEVLINLDPSTIARTPDIIDPDTMMVTEMGRDVSGLEDVRLNWENALRVNIVGNLQAELKFVMLFDNVPVGIQTLTPAKKLDTTTTLNLVYTIL
jgi:putative salt-induced outer membrane protein YdiY